MSEPRSKADKEAGNLSETTKTYVKEWLTQQIYGVDKHISTKEIEKGITCEDEAIQTYGAFKNDFFIKNEKHFDNGDITGTPDIITENFIIDVKCSWDCYTFPAFEEKLPTNLYYWQLQGYMELCNKEYAKITYCLMNTPLHLAHNDLDLVDYNEYPLNKRFKEFEVIRDNDSIQKIYERVEQIRNYINTLDL